MYLLWLLPGGVPSGCHCGGKIEISQIKTIFQLLKKKELTRVLPEQFHNNEWHLALQYSQLLSEIVKEFDLHYDKFLVMSTQCAFLCSTGPKF